jgi:YbgC/YbaW family acyl-CoA thioester hydrolase
MALESRASEFRYRRRVQFADTDCAGMVHFARYFALAEEAEHAFLRSRGLSVHTPGEGSSLGFPRVAARMEYRKPLAFEDEVEVHIWVRRKGRSSITYQFRLTRVGVGGGEDEVARGEVTAACCRVHPGGRAESVPVPPAFEQALEEASCPPLSFTGGDPGR